MIFQYTYAFRRVTDRFILGIAQPTLYKNANITFVPSARLNIRYKQSLAGSLNVKKECNSKLKPTKASPGDQTTRRDLICELKSGMEFNKGQIMLAKSWKYCNFRQDDAFSDKRCSEIDQAKAIFSYISGLNFKALKLLNFKFQIGILITIVMKI